MLQVPESVFQKLFTATNKMAEDVKLLKDRMTGRGIPPAEAPIVQAKLLELENKLRKIAADPDNWVPFN